MATDLDKEKYWGLFKLDGKSHLEELRAHRGDDYLTANYGSLQEEADSLDSMISMIETIRIEEDDRFIVLFLEHGRGSAIFSKQYKTITSRGIFHRIHGGTYQPRTKAYKYCTVRRFIANTQEIYKRDFANRFLSKVAEHVPDATRWYRKLTIDDPLIFNILSALSRGASANEIKVMDEVVKNYRIILSKPMMAYYVCSLVKHGLSAVEIVETISGKGVTTEIIKVVSCANLIQHSTVCHDINVEVGKATQFIEVLQPFKVLKTIKAPQAQAPAKVSARSLGLIGNSQINDMVTDVTTLSGISTGTVFEPYVVDHASKPQYSDSYELYTINGCLASTKLGFPGLEYLKVACTLDKCNTDKVSISLILRAITNYFDPAKYTFKSGQDLISLLDELKELFDVPTYYKLIKYIRMGSSSHSLKTKAKLYSLLDKYLKPSNKLYKPIIDYSNEPKEQIW